MVANRTEASKWLHKFGYLEKPKPTNGDFSKALKTMQERFGLKVDGQLGPITSRVMNFRRCGLHDRKRISVPGSTDCRWSRSVISYYHAKSFRLSNMAQAATQKAIQEALASWAKYVPLTFPFQETKKSADVVFGQGTGSRYDFDGVGNTLAWAYMPCDKEDSQLLTMYDGAEPWTDNPLSHIGVYARAVIAHEWGHILGLDHSTDDGDLMAPFYNPMVFEPQPTDIKRIRSLYGVVDEPPPGGVGPSGAANVAGKMTITDNGVSLDLAFI